LLADEVKDKNGNLFNHQEIQLLPERFRELADAEQFILTVTENGYGKRTSAYEYRTTGRGGVGIDSIIVNQRNGNVVASFPVTPKDQIMLVTDQGQIIRCPVHDIRLAGRRTQGVTIFRVGTNEKVVAVAKIPGDEEESEGGSE
jgi:DNA gyrase subunit A